MAIILPQRWTRQPQYRVPIDPRWAQLGLNLALLPHGNGFVDCSRLNRQGSGGVRTQSTCTQGKTVLRTSGSYAFRGLLQNNLRFSVLAVIKPTNITAEGVICQSSSAVTTGTAQFTILDSQINLISGNEFIVAASTNSGLVANRTHNIIVTFNEGGGTHSTTFYADGKKLNTVTGAAPTFVADGNGLVFVKQSGSDPFTGGIALLADFNTVLSDDQAIALSANPWQLFMPRAGALLVEDAVAGVSGTSATTNANDTSSASGTTTIVGASARTNANDTSAASGTTTILGTSARTNANDTSNASGTVGQVTGTSATTNANDTSSASGTTTVKGTSATTNANDASNASGVVGSVTGTAACTNNNDTCNASGNTPAPPTPTPTQAMGGLSSSRNKTYYIERDGKRIFFTDESEVYDLLHQEEEKLVKKSKKAIQRVTKSEVAEIVTFADFDIPKPQITFKTNDAQINKEIARINERINAGYMKALMRHVEQMEEEEVFIALLLG